MNEFPFHYVKIPEDLPDLPKHLTFGKFYKVEAFGGLSVSSPGYVFTIRNDIGNLLFCIEKNSVHISGKAWVVCDYQKNLEDILK